MARVRLDLLLTERGLFSSRARAAAAIIAGDVHLLPGRQRAEKPGQLVSAETQVAVAARPEFVSRGGVKLANALRATGVTVTGRRALDIGASTGGFTDCLLQRGAAHVVAVDVGYGELDWRLRQDERVTVIERVNARVLKPQDLPYRPDLVTIDVSFISLDLILPAALACTASAFDLLALVKPQFEVGRERVGKGGVVRNPDHRRAALVHAGEIARGLGATVLGIASSGLPGPKGNLESFLWLGQANPDAALLDLDVAAREVEP